MKKLPVICLILLFIPLFTSAQDHPLEELFFENIAALYFATDGTPVVIKNASTYKVAVIDPESFEIRNEIIRDGKGPGELKRIYAFGFDEIKNEACIIGVQIRLICSDLDGNTTFDRSLSWITSYSPGTPLEFLMSDGRMILPLHGLLSIKNPQEEITVAALTSTADTEEVEFLRLSPEDMGLSYLDELSVANNLFIKPRVLKLDEEHILITVAGLPYFYVFRNGELLQRTEIGTDYEVKITASMKPEFPSPGVMTPANINNVLSLGEDSFLLSRGNTYQDIPTGMDLYEYKILPDRVLFNRTKQIPLGDLPEGVSEPRITVSEEGVFMITNYIFMASQIYYVGEEL